MSLPVLIRIWLAIKNKFPEMFRAVKSISRYLIIVFPVFVLDFIFYLLSFRCLHKLKRVRDFATQFNISIG